MIGKKCEQFIGWGLLKNYWLNCNAPYEQGLFMIGKEGCSLIYDKSNIDQFLWSVGCSIIGGVSISID